MINEKNTFMPMVIERTGGGERAYDLPSRLLQDRIVFLNGEVNDASANAVIAQLIYLEGQDPSKDISLYINSPGGSVSAGLAIYDTMNYIKCDVSTICMGMAASMGAFLLSSGAKGKRYALPNAEVMIHQPLGGAQGQASDIKIAAEHILRTKAKLNRIMAENCGRPVSDLERDTDRDNWLTAEQAKEYAEDPLSAGVEIVACPPGKKLTKISLLSGGERALTAIAILFAILRARPMPFCILDEIEAALDDANVDRFASYLKRFAEETQFIVITHRKPTMNQADSLFGVTMQEKGVSKIVSVKLAEVEAKLGAGTVE